MHNNERFPKSKRLLKRRDYSRVHARHSTFSHHQILITYRRTRYHSHEETRNQEVKSLDSGQKEAVISKKSQGSRQDQVRLGMVLTRKNGSSVERNLCKRRTREIFRKIRWPEFLIVDLVVRVKGLLKTVEFQDISEAFSMLYQKITSNDS